MDNNWNISGLILDGVCGTGKTTILGSLIQSERFTRKTYLSSIVLSEHLTQRVLERKEREEGLTKSDNVALLDQHVAYLECMNDRLEQMQWCKDNRSNMRIPYILERFHFTHVYHYKHMTWEDVEPIDCRLAKLNCKLCLFVMNDAMLEDRIIAGRNSDWKVFLTRYGKTNDEIVQYYATRQKMLRGLCEKSELKTLILDTTDSSVEDTLNQVLDFWGAI